MLTCPTAPTLLMPGSHTLMDAALDRYPAHYDDVFDRVHEQLVEHGFATKYDLSALTCWKYIPRGTWMKAMQSLPEATVEKGTRAAFASNLSDAQRIAALGDIGGFSRGGAVTSALLAAWHPDEYGVFDARAYGAWPLVVSAECTCKRESLPIWFAHLRQLAAELGGDWTPRKVDIALFNLIPDIGSS